MFLLKLHSCVGRIFLPSKPHSCFSSYLRFTSFSASTQANVSNYPQVVSIGDTLKEVEKPQNFHLVPLFYYNHNSTQTELGHLQWMLKKDLLGQDIFLIGPPGPAKRRLAMAFAELTSREVEYLSLSRDTTEGDMKQRREISNRTAQHIDQAAVRAAIHGRLLIIEGIEKAERNVLPLLNNLLENREMNLEDGRHLIASERYDDLLKAHGQEAIDKWKLICVNKNFRVIALGLPVPFFQGNPLDPPLRSRFQGRSITPLTSQESLQSLSTMVPNASVEKLKILNDFGYAVLWSNDPDFKETEGGSWHVSLPHFPLDNLTSAAQLLEAVPDINVYRVLVRLYPYDLLLSSKQDESENEIKTIEKVLKDYGFEIASMESNGSLHEPKEQSNSYIPVRSQEALVSEMLESLRAKKDICLVGNRGAGKSICVARFAQISKLKIEPIVMYKDMTARDLLQQRTTTSDGNTIWRNSPLVDAALNGKLAVLDGIDMVHPSTLSVIHGLVQDRELQLYDGKRLIRWDRFDEMKTLYGYTDDQLNSAFGVYRIHPNFSIVATACPPSKQNDDKKKKKWLTTELLNLFFFHQLPELSIEEEMEIICLLSKSEKHEADLTKMLQTARSLRRSKEPSKQSLAASLSTRQLIRISKRTQKFKNSGKESSDNVDMFRQLSQACLYRFLPPLNKEELVEVMSKNGIRKCHLNPNEASLRSIELDDSRKNLRIGNTFAEVCSDGKFKSKVPHLLFYEIPQHIEALERLLQDFELGEHLLLVGNQGVGKNKLVDQLLFLLNRPREYIQLHRDTTVQSLTLQQKVIDGVVTTEDSPLVMAARDGHVIVIDEADKAPTHVTSIIKTLAESGEMVLSDGRRIVPKSVLKEQIEMYSPDEYEKIIPLHEDFRMFVLANRPGFPFLGNDFFSVLGDLFSVHAIDNPSFESEIQLLKQYGPDVDIGCLELIAKAFGDLRSMADDGTINYPYSTREAVSIVKHLQKFPGDSITEAIDNVFDFDAYNLETRQALKETLSKYNLHPSEGLFLRDRIKDNKGHIVIHKMPKAEIEKLKREGHLGPFMDSNKIFTSKDFTGPKFGKIDPKNAPHVGGNTWAGGTGGSNTAGLGGAGGPYRLDAGHTVFQVADSAKEAVPPEIRKMAREMAQKFFEEKMKEIKMSKYEGRVYEEYLGPIRPQVKALRVILQSLQAKQKERKWVRHQTSGELDDGKLIEGVVGEKNIYKQRKDEEPEPGDPQQKPKRLKLLVDVSGSMYRFNGYDRRLDRVIECALMVMEAFKGFEDIFEYEIIGHSGDDYKLPIVSRKSIPSNEKERLDTMRIMHLHSQTCMSGDNTLEALHDAVHSFDRELDECDEAFVILLSDANLERYGISPDELTKILNANAEVKAFSIFIGSLGDQADRLSQQLPPGKSFVCLDASKLPKILQRIFTQSILA